MKRCIRFVIAISFAFATAQDARAQVVSLLVGNQSGHSGLDRYDGTTGAYLGDFGIVGSGTFFSYFKYGGPNNNLFVQQFPNVLQFDGHTGSFINTFISQPGIQFAFGPDNNLYRKEGSAPYAIGKYDGSTGVRLGTFVDGSVSGITSGSGSMRFGPDGHLYVDNGNTIARFNGTTGNSLGSFIAPGSGGLQSVTDAVFASNGDLIVSGNNGTTNDTIWRFNGASGVYLGIFTSGAGIATPIGITEGPDGKIYVASVFNSQIKRFELSTGAFVDNFVSSTAHMFPSYIAFTPFPVPEPASWTLLGMASIVAFGLRIRGKFRRSIKGTCLDHTGTTLLGGRNA